MKTVILGAGPAGLAAAWTLAGKGEVPIVLERSTSVGGICRTVCYRGYYMDIGGHRFFTKFDEVQALWEEVLGDDLIRRPRQSRIFYGGKLYDYPLRASNALRNLGPIEATRCMLSYGRARLRERGEEDSFEEWVSNRFGDRLFDIFFRTYTEKVWGIPTSEIGADWAAQRIKNMELSTAVKRAVMRGLGPVGRRLRRNEEVVTSLIEEFWYPRLGPGMMYDVMAEQAVERGTDLRHEHTVVRLEHEGGRIHTVVSQTADGEVTLPADEVLSSIPLTVLVQCLSPAAPPEVLESARALTYRHLLVVFLIVDEPELFTDNWVYVHDKNLQLGRLQNFRNWSPEMVPDPKTTCLGLEYFCSDGDPIWNMTPDELQAMGRRELAATGLLPSHAKVLDGSFVRVPRAYPVYARGYEEHLDRIVEYVKGFSNLHPMGRYGMFKYNNSDHSILTALLTVENLYGARHAVWNVNTDSDYHEVRR